MNNESNYGLLLSPAIKLHRKYFEEMTKLLGIKVLFRAPKPNKHYTNYSEIDTNFEKPVCVGCIFEEHPEQQTLKKLGWVSELQENASIIHVPYDLQGIQQGAVFLIPSAIDNSEGRIFRVGKMRVGMIYPASITCELVPEYINTFSDNSLNFKHSSFNLLQDEEIDV